MSDDTPSILSKLNKMQSRHVTAKQYTCKCWMIYVEGVKSGWYCRCKEGCRMVGMCSHINSVILVSVIDASNSNEDSVVREYLSCFVVQLVC